MTRSTPTDLPLRYRDAEWIARGAMGDVCRATDSVLGRTVAVKLLAQPLARDPSALRRFEREARAAARLSGDPHIVTIYDAGEWTGRPYIVMEYLPGGTLEERLRAEGRVPPAQAVRLLEQAGEALDHAHVEGVVHRDVKPGNLLLDGGGNLCVADFGIASAAGAVTVTATGTVLGSAGYLAPEQALGERTSAGADRYSLAVVAYELLTGTRPFARESATAEAAAHVNEPVPPASGRTDLPPAVDAVFERALAKRPEDRCGSCAELVAALRRALDGAEDATQALPTVVPPPNAEAHRVRFRPPLAAALVAAVLGGGAALAVTLSGGGSKAPGVPSATTRRATAAGAPARSPLGTTTATRRAATHASLVQEPRQPARPPKRDKAPKPKGPKKHGRGPGHGHAPKHGPGHHRH
jgi:serine/threonine protein kinase